LPGNRVAVFSAGDVRLAGGLASMTYAVIDGLESGGYAVDTFMPNWTDGRGWGVKEIEFRGRTWTCAQYIRSTNFGAALQVGFQLRKRLRQYDFLVAVVGSGIWTLALAFTPQPATAWVATPFEEEFTSRFRAESVPGRLALSAIRMMENVAERLALNRSSLRHIFALSHNTRSLLMQRHHLSGDRLSVLYPPVDQATFHASPNDHARASRCITVSRLDDQRKNVVELIEMWPEIVARRPEAELVLVGSFDAAGPVARAVGASPARSSIRMTGALGRTAVADELRHASVFVLPSRQEGLGIVVMEALACGLPVVAFRNGGTDELLSGNGAGRVVLNGDRAAFIRETIALLQDSLESPSVRSEEFFRRCGTPLDFSTALQSVVVQSPLKTVH